MKIAVYCALVALFGSAEAFLLHTKPRSVSTTVGHVSRLYTTAAVEEERKSQKKALLGLLRKTDALGTVDPVLADPDTKEPIRISVSGTLLGGDTSQRIKYEMRSSTNKYSGSSDTFLNLLEPITTTTKGGAAEGSNTRDMLNEAIKSISVFIPPPIRSALATAGAPMGDDYVPMRDLFTSSTVSFAYERGWRQGFAQAGFPGADIEFQMAKVYFDPAVAMSKSSVVVDMSCATGLFTRRFAICDEYDRVIGADYSESMLTEARRRIRAEPELSPSKLSRTQLDLVRLDVGRIPMQTESVDALHAGAAMHCWPDLQSAAKEVYRVLKPGGRYFATTFLSQYFRTLQVAEGGTTGPSRQAFQYFESVDQLRKLMEYGGFDHEKIQIEVLGTACVVIRCEK